MTYSLNEIEAMGKRATRGAGLDWGLAEEAGKAVRWLSACRLPGARALAEVLRVTEGKTYDDLAPVSADGIWRAPSGLLSPLQVGPAITDRAASIAAGHVIEIGEITKPLLLIPYLGAAAKLTNTDLEITWLGVNVIVTPNGVSVQGDQVNDSKASDVRCRRQSNTPQSTSVQVTQAQVTGCDVDGETWDCLGQYMGRYLAPDTEQSRIAGAGAGLSDND